MISASELEARSTVTLPVGVVILRPRRRRREHRAEVVLSLLTMLLVAFVLVCVRHAVHICPVRFLP